MNNNLGNLVFLENSLTGERSWHLLHTDVGSILLCNWYRPPSSSIDHIESFREELERLSESTYGVIVLGDLNIHHRQWLYFSNADTPEGELLKDICDDHDLRQLVDKPTRGNYLLDLCLTNLESCKIRGGVGIM